MGYTEPHISTSALVTIDAQVDFTYPGAPAEIPGTYELLPKMVRLLSWYRKNKLPIIHVIRLYRPDGSNVDLCRRELIESGKRIVEPDTDGAELVEELKPSIDVRLDASTLLEGKAQYWEDYEAVIYKPRWGAFFKTPLEEVLNKLGVDTLVFCGCNFPNCPRTSIYEASERDFRIVLIEDAVSGLYDRGREELLSIGVELMDTEALVNQELSEDNPLR